MYAKSDKTAEPASIKKIHPSSAKWLFGFLPAMRDECRSLPRRGAGQTKRGAARRSVKTRARPPRLFTPLLLDIVAGLPEV